MPKPGSRCVYGPNYGGSLQRSRAPQNTASPSRPQKEELYEEDIDELMEEARQPPKAWSVFLKNRPKPMWQATKGKRHIMLNCRKAAQLLRDHLRRDDEDKKLTKLHRALFEEFIEALEGIVDRQRIPCKSPFNIAGSASFDEEGTMNLLEYRLQAFVVPSSFFHLCDSAINRAVKPLRVV